MIMLLLAMTLVTTRPAEVQIWPTHPLENVFPDTSPPASPHAAVVKLSAARGQKAEAQIVVRAEREDVVRAVEFSPLAYTDAATKLPARFFHWYFVDYQRVERNSTQTPAEELLRKAPAEFPDAFSEEKSIKLSAGKSQPIWVQFDVPEDARAGRYSGEITVITRSARLRLPVELTVYDFTLPAPRLLVSIWINDGALASHMNVEPHSEAYWKLVDCTAKLMRSHHINVVYTPWQMIQARRTAGGQIALDFARLDRWISIFLANRFERIEISHLGVREKGQWEDKNFITYKMSCRDQTTRKAVELDLEDWLPLLEAHLRARGWIERTMIHVADEPTAVNFQSWRALSRRVKKLAPSLRRIEAIHYPDFAGDLETWVPQLNYLETWPGEFEQVRESGAELWFYTAWVPQGRYPNRLVDYPLLKTRILHWFNYTTNTSGYLHWALNQWHVPFDTLAPGDNWIIWTGKHTPRSSMRFEAMRAGIEDHAYLVLLEQSAREAAQRLKLDGFDARKWTLSFIATLTVDLQNYPRDPRVLLSMRDSVARAIEAFAASDRTKLPPPFGAAATRPAVGTGANKNPRRS